MRFKRGDRVQFVGHCPNGVRPLTGVVLSTTLAERRHDRWVIAWDDKHHIDNPTMERYQVRSGWELSPEVRCLPVTFAAGRAILSTFGVTIRKTGFGDIRVSVRGGGEASAYYASDVEDAVLTGLSMAGAA